MLNKKRAGTYGCRLNCNRTGEWPIARTKRYQQPQKKRVRVRGEGGKQVRGEASKQKSLMISKLPNSHLLKQGKLVLGLS